MSDVPDDSSSQANAPMGFMTYADAGVDIDAGNELVKRIAPLAKATARIGSNPNIGGFGGLFDLKACGYSDPILVAANDGVGTKLKIAIAANSHKTVGIDLVAMSVNDLVVQGAEPLFFLDYFAAGRLELDTATDVIAGIAEGCSQAGCALIGGETAEMPGMYADGDYDLAGFSVGAVERNAVLPRQDINENDVLLGLASNGIHSNGFSLVRKLVEKSGLAWDADCPFESTHQTLAQALLAPTRIYVKSLLAVLKETSGLKALCHITGGGLPENLPRVLTDNIHAEINLSSWSLPAVFDWLQKQGNIETSELLRIFNCGIGMVLVVAPDVVADVTAILEDAGETVFKIGTLAEGNTPVHFNGSFA